MGLQFSFINCQHLSVPPLRLHRFCCQFQKYFFQAYPWESAKLQQRDIHFLQTQRKALPGYHIRLPSTLFWRCVFCPARSGMDITDLLYILTISPRTSAALALPESPQFQFRSSFPPVCRLYHLPPVFPLDMIRRCNPSRFPDLRQNMRA